MKEKARTYPTRRAATVISLALFIASSARAGEQFSIDGAHSTVAFLIKYLGLIDVQGRFNQLSGTIVYDDQDPTRTSFTSIIKTNSIDSGVAERDNHLRSADFFDAEKYPVIMFQSGRMDRTETGYRATGTLTMHGVSKAIHLPLTLTGKIKDMREDTHLVCQSTITLNRHDFGIHGPANWAGGLIGDDVQVT